MTKHGIMRFMGKTLHHNPHSIEITSTANIVQEQIPFLHSVSGNVGTAATVIRGEGVFYGQDAFEQYLQLKKIYTNGKSGALSLSGINPMYAYLQKLSLKSKPVDDYVEYTFIFVEALGTEGLENSTAPPYYTVGENEDLWDIANKLSISIDRLVGLNPQLKNTADVKEGDRVRINDI